MKKKILSFVLIFSICLMVPTDILAHPGRKDANGCHYCRTNCAQWGLSNHEYHCHGGSNTNPTFNNGGNTQITVSRETPKSSDNTLKSISIDGTLIPISNRMTYQTKKEKVEILVEANDSKATYKVDNHILKVGNNDINITVTAENGDQKNYTLQIKREKLSNNTNIKVIVDGKVIDFENGKASMSVSSDTKKVNYKYTLEDRKARVETNGNSELKYGENVITFKVVAEDGTEKIYQLTIDRTTKIVEIISTIIGLAMMGGIGYGIYYIYTMTKKK